MIWIFCQDVAQIYNLILINTLQNMNDLEEILPCQ